MPFQYRNYLLTILLLIAAFSFVDRIALGVLLQDIKIDLALSDTQLGLMSGIAFALFYSIMGIPLARWADRGNRVTIISLTAALWSVMVALCGMAGSFAQLLLIRIGVGVGEAGCGPAANSLMADYFTRAERPRAAAIYTLGTSLGFVVGYFFAGWLNRFYGWRTTFILLGSPGTVLAALAWFTLKEPRRTKPTLQIASLTRPEISAPFAAQPSLKDVCVTLWTNTTFRHLLFGLSVVYFFSYGIVQWQPTFFIRSYGLTSGELGTWFAVIYGLGGILGTYGGGEWASRRAAHNERMQLKAAAFVYASLSIIYPFIYLSANHYLAFGLLGVVSLISSTINGPLLATVQTLVPERMRAMSIALIFLFANLIGMGLGPLAAGALSDALRPWAGQESLRCALLVLSPGYFWAAWHFWHASRTVTQDLNTLHCAGPGGDPEGVIPVTNGQFVRGDV
jgi:MFS family permease